MNALAERVAHLQELSDLARVGLDHGDLTRHSSIGNPEFQRMAAEFPDDIVSYPHIFEQINA